jgi:hypothetical protein
MLTPTPSEKGNDDRTRSPFPFWEGIGKSYRKECDRRIRDRVLYHLTYRYLSLDELFTSSNSLYGLYTYIPSPLHKHFLEMIKGHL